MLMWRLLPQTNPKTSFAALQPKVILDNYKTLFRSTTLWGFLLCVAFMMAGEKAYTTSAAFLFIKQIGLSSVEYGYLTAGIWAAHLSGTFLAGWLALRLGVDRVMSVGVVLIAVPGFVLLALGLLGMENIGLFVAAMLIYMLGTGFVIVSAAVGIVRPFPKLIGFATAFAMALEFAVSSLSSWLMSHYSSSMTAIAIMVGIMGILTLLAKLLFLNKT